jgi:hypothetical protein
VIEVGGVQVTVDREATMHADLDVLLNRFLHG